MKKALKIQMQIKNKMKFSRIYLLIELYCNLNLIADGKKRYTLKHKAHEHSLYNWPIGDELIAKPKPK